MKKKICVARKSESGFSVIELLAVLLIIGVLSSISIFYLAGNKKAYMPDDESLLVTDVFQEARQRSLTQRETMRVEINLTTNAVSLYDENSPTTANDDNLIKRINLYVPTDVKVGTLPGNIGYVPNEPLPVPVATFIPSVYPSSISQTVCTLRFLSNGTVVNAGNNAIGSGAVPTGATIPFWSPNKATPANADIARAITVIGSTGTVRLWEFDWGLAAPNKWKDSRRYGTFGGAAGNGNANVP